MKKYIKYAQVTKQTKRTANLTVEELLENKVPYIVQVFYRISAVRWYNWFHGVMSQMT